MRSLKDVTIINWQASCKPSPEGVRRGKINICMKKYTLYLVLLCLLLASCVSSNKSSNNEPLGEKVENLEFSLPWDGVHNYDNRYKLSTTSNRILISAIQYLYNSLNNPSSFKVTNVDISEKKAGRSEVLCYVIGEKVTSRVEEEISGTATWSWYHVKEINDTLVYCNGEPYPLSKLMVDSIKVYDKENLSYTVYSIEYAASYPFGVDIRGKESVYVVSENELYFESQIYNTLKKESMKKTYYCETIHLDWNRENAKENWFPREAMEGDYSTNDDSEIFFIIKGVLVDSVLDKTLP